MNEHKQKVRIKGNKKKQQNQKKTSKENVEAKSSTQIWTTQRW